MNAIETLASLGPLAASAPHHRLGIGLILIVILVLGGLGFGVVRLSGRRRASGVGQAGGRGEAMVGAPAPGGVASAQPVRDNLPARSPGEERAGPPRSLGSLGSARAVVSPGGWAVETHGLTKWFGANVAVDDVELLVPRGCAFGYLGPNGAGKTTLIRTLLGLTRANSGTMSLLGTPVAAERSRALARVGAIVDEPRFHPYLTGRENLRLLAAARGGDTDQRITPSLARVGLAERADDKVASYSMGMRQRPPRATSSRTPGLRQASRSASWG